MAEGLLHYGAAGSGHAAIASIGRAQRPCFLTSRAMTERTATWPTVKSQARLLGRDGCYPTISTICRLYRCDLLALLAVVSVLLMHYCGPMRTLLALVALVPGSALAAMYGTPETCRGDFTGSEVPILIIEDRLHEPDAVCTFDGRCANANGKTWVDLVTVEIKGLTAVVTYEDGDIVLQRCE